MYMDLTVQLFHYAIVTVTLLSQQLRNTYNQDAADNGGSPLLLTAAVSASRDTIDKAYDIPEISL